MNVRAFSLFIVSVFAFSGVLLADPTPPETEEEISLEITSELKGSFQLSEKAASEE